jgi:carbon-monoxide dehydrogenase medium subunit
MYDFAYYRPNTVEEALALLAGNADLKLLAGGMSLIPALKLRLARHSGIVDLNAIEGLDGIRREGDNLVIGAMTRHATVAASPEVAKAMPALALLAEGIGDPLVRNRGTIGGSIANADPAADYPAALVGLRATVWTNQRRIASDGFFSSFFETALESGEIITAVSFPIPEVCAYAKLAQPASRFAIAGVFLARAGGRVCIAVTGAGPCVFRWKEAEAALERRFEASALVGVEIEPAALNTDIHASAEYRAHCVRVLAKRALLAAHGEG